MTPQSLVRHLQFFSRPFYLTQPHLWHAYAYNLNRRMAVHHGQKFVYARIPKAANSTVCSTLYKYIHGHDAPTMQAAKDFFTLPSVLSFAETAEAKRAYFKFTFVRNPYQRVLSAYLDKIEVGDKEILSPATEDEIAEQRHRRRLRGKVRERLHRDGPYSFEDFCGYLANGGLYDDPHWMPQHLYVNAMGAGTMDFIGKTEQMAIDLAVIIDRLFPGHDTLMIREERRHATGADDKMSRYYDPVTQALVLKLYEADFNFGYDKTPPWITAPQRVVV